MNKHRITKALCSLIIILLCLCSCSDVQTVSITKGTQAIASDSSKKLCVSKNKLGSLTKIAQSSRVALYFDEETCSVCVYNLDTKKLWRSLPEAYNSKSTATPDVLGVSIIADGKSYTLNSQQHSVSNGLASFKKTESGIKISYTFSFDVDSKNVSFTVPVEYTLTDGSLFVTVNCADIKIGDETDVIIREIRLLNYFGSTLKGESGDYMLVPDGCGAIMLTDKTVKDTKAVKLAVYGSDPSDETTLAAAPVGAYGFKQGTDAAVAVIENADAIATIYSDITQNCGCNYTGAGFEITDAYKNEDGTLSISSQSYTGEIRLCYRFLSDNNANYAAMASACREQLIRGDVLSQNSLTETADLPVIVSVIGAASPNGKSSLTELTTFEQAQDMLTLLKAKGLSNIYLKYKGVFDGGLNPTDISDFSINDSLGTKDDFTALSEYMQAQELKLFFDIDVLSAAKGSYPRGCAAKNITDSPFRTVITPELSGDTQYTRSLLKISKLEEKILDVLTASRNPVLSGFCLNDAGGMLYSDYSDNQYAVRQAAKQNISTQCRALATNRELMVNNGNVYLLKNVSAVNDIPMSTSYKRSTQYRAIPFFQIIIHGTMYYSPCSLNLEKNYETAFLRCIEYAAVPSFEWCYTGIDPQSDYAYASWATKAYELYEQANEALNDLSGTRITNHYQVGANVYCTVFAGNTMIYVNYSNKPFDVNGTPVEARSFLRIN